MMPSKMLIDGHWVDARDGRRFPVDNPATGDTVAEVPFGSAADVAPVSYTHLTCRRRG